MNFCWVTLHVGDLEKSLGFYRDFLGLEVFSRFSGGGKVEIAMMGKKDAPKVELLCDGGARDRERGAGVSLGFEVGSLERAVEDARRRGIPVGAGPISPNPNLRFSFVRDPDGYEVQLVEQRKSASA